MLQLDSLRVTANGVGGMGEGGEGVTTWYCEVCSARGIIGLSAAASTTEIRCRLLLTEPLWLRALHDTTM